MVWVTLLLHDYTIGYVSKCLIKFIAHCRTPPRLLTKLETCHEMFTQFVEFVLRGVTRKTWSLLSLFFCRRQRGDLIEVFKIATEQVLWYRTICFLHHQQLIQHQRTLGREQWTKYRCLQKPVYQKSTNKVALLRMRWIWTSFIIR